MTRISMAIIFLLLMVPMASAEDEKLDGPGRSVDLISLNDVIIAAVEQYPALGAAGFMSKAARNDMDIVSAMKSPRIDFSATFSALDNPMYAFGTKLNQESISEMNFDPHLLNDPDVAYNTNYSIRISYPLYTGGVIENSRKAAESNYMASRESEKNTGKMIATTAAQSFIGAVYIKERGKVLKVFEDTAKEHRDLAESFVRNGMTVEADLLAAEVFLSSAKQEVIENTGKLKTAVSAIRHLTFDTIPVSVELIPGCVEDCAVLAGRDDSNLELLVEYAMENRNEIMELEHQVDAVEYVIAAKKGEGKPQVGLGGQYELNLKDPFRGNGESFSVMLQLTQSINDGGARKAEIQKLNNQKNGLLKMLEEKISSIRLEVSSAWNDLNASNEAVGVTKDAIAMAGENLRITTNRYKNGLINYIELKDAENMLKMAKLQNLGAMYQVHLSRFNLDLATGAMDKYYSSIAEEN